MGSLFVTGNAIEAAVWVVCGLSCAYRPAGRWPAVVLFLMGASDVVEIYTGAWWRPPGLLICKIACIALLLRAYLQHGVSHGSSKRER